MMLQQTFNVTFSVTFTVTFSVTFTVTFSVTFSVIFFCFHLHSRQMNYSCESTNIHKTHLLSKSLLFNNFICN